MREVLEHCFQCGVGALQHPVVNLQSVDDVAKLDRDFDIIELRDDNKFVLVPYCHACHREPKYGGHFFYRRDANIGLRMAGSENIG